MTDPTWQLWQELTPPWSGEYAQGVLLPGCVFLFAQETSPLPAATQAGWWQWFETPKDLVNYLRCAGLPDFLDLWFDRNSYDADFRRTRVDPRETLKVAKERGFRTEDIPAVERVLDALDNALDLPDDKTLAEAAFACGHFTERFGSTPTWHLILRVYPTLLDAAEQLRADEFEPQLEDEQWRNLVTAAANGDQAAAESLAQEFREAEYY